MFNIKLINDYYFQDTADFSDCSPVHSPSNAGKTSVVWKATKKFVLDVTSLMPSHLLVDFDK